MITWSDDRQRSDAGKGAMRIDGLESGIGAYVRAHLGQPVPFGVGLANSAFRIRTITVRGAG